MKYILAMLLCVFALTFSGCANETAPPETSVPTTQATLPPTVETVPETTVPEIIVPETHPPQLALELTDEEKTMLLKIAMAERGNCGCTECIALVMCSILNRVESGRFGSSIRSVLHSQDQYTPVVDGTYFTAKPNECCYDALDMVIYGWDESQGALYYEFCKGESWHSKNLNLLFQHCDTRFYN